MTLSSTTSRVSYSGNGSTTAFSFPYYFLADSDLVVIIRVTSTGVETTKTITTHYTVSGSGNQAGGTVTMLTAPASGETITIYRDPAKTQDLDLVENDPMPAEEIEERLDKSMMIDQRLSDLQSRSVRLSDGFSSTFDTSLPSLLTANQALIVNGDGDGFELASIDADTTSVLSTKGDLATFSTAVGRLAVGANNKILTAASGEATGLKWGEGPLTTKGDLFTYSTAGERIAVGTNGKRLVADSAQSTGLSWVYNTVVSKAFADTPYTATALDDLILVNATGGAVTVNLPAAASSSGKILAVQKTDSSTNAVTLDGNSSETIAGLTTYALSANKEFIVLQCDGSNWHILSQTKSKCFSYASGAITLPGSGETRVASFAGTITTVGSDLTPSDGDGTTTGDKWTVVTPGVYFMKLTFIHSGAATNAYIKVNGSVSSSSSEGLPIDVAGNQTTGSGALHTISGLRYLSVGDVVRVHVSATDGASTCNFEITKVRD